LSLLEQGALAFGEFRALAIARRVEVGAGGAGRAAKEWVTGGRGGETGG
jgi:hypothetical protein